MKLKIFLSGAEKNVSDDFTSWREKVKLNTNVFDVKILDPVEHFNYTDKNPRSTKQCYNHFMWLIDKSDIVLVNLDLSNSSVGTGCEVQHAYHTNKPVIGFGESPATWYEWTSDKCDVIFKTFDEAFNYILEHYSI